MARPLTESVCATVGVLLSTVTSLWAQQQSPVFRVSTELVQTDVMVFDKDDRFVNGLRREDFELRIDGKLKPVTFFERVAAGSASEASQLSAARAGVSPGQSGATAPLYHGRTIFFYVDDLHLDLGGLTAAQKLIDEFIEEEMSQDDEVGIASASGQVGFLQQLTDDKAVLRLALQRIKVRPNSVRDLDRPPMSEYQALLIERFDHEVTSFFVRETVRNNPGMITLAQAENIVRGRSRFLLQQAAQITANTLSGLESLVRSSSRRPGRKLVFFLSGGFLLDNSRGNNNLRRITSAAARTGAVIYSVDARGLVGGLTDASTAVADLSDRLARASLGELTATQDAMSALARDTGGRPIFNTNALGAAVSRVLEETSAYYLLAWEPDQETQKSRAFRTLEVKLVGRPDLTVRVRRGFFDVDPLSPGAEKPRDRKPPDGAPAALLQEAIIDASPERTTPISLSLNHLLTGRETRLTASIHIPVSFLTFNLENGKQRAAVRIAGVIFNDRGEGQATFDEVLNLDRSSADPRKGSEETVSQELSIAPGLYLVQVGVRDERSGRIGTARSWVEIPQLAAGQLALSSLNIGARRFQRNATLRFFLFAYNAARAPGSKPDLAVEVQLARENRPILRTSFKKLAVDDEDVDRIPYAADLSLADLPAGRYVLKLTIIDRLSGASASQQARFEIE